MEKNQAPIPTLPSSDQNSTAPDAAGFTPGDAVVYGMHGRCTVVGIESRTIGGNSVPFYKLEVQKSPLSRSTRREPAIWLPVNSAGQQGLRQPMTRDQADAVMATLASREYHFRASESWSSLQTRLEQCLRTEGTIGLAKVHGFLHVLKRREIVLSPEINRFQEAVSKLLLRELSDALAETPRATEERMNRALRNKLLPDH